MGAERSHTDLETDTPMSQGKPGVGLSGRWSAPQEGIKRASQRKRYRSEILEGQAGGDVVEDGEQH